jgi:hypothetical protein
MSKLSPLVLLAIMAWILGQTFARADEANQEDANTPPTLTSFG